jgi:sugar-specific transcriptional regulator TrmB
VDRVPPDALKQSKLNCKQRNTILSSPFLISDLTEADKLSLERVIKALIGLGLSQTDAEVYVHLATTGPATARNIIRNLAFNKRQVYRSLKRLQSKGITITSDEHPSEFSALPFEEVLDLLVEVKREQAKTLRESKRAVLSNWRKIVKENSEKS